MRWIIIYIILLLLLSLSFLLSMSVRLFLSIENLKWRKKKLRFDPRLSYVLLTFEINTVIIILNG